MYVIQGFLYQLILTQLVKIFLPLVDKNVRHYFHEVPPFDAILSQLKPVHTFTIYSSKINFKVIIPYTQTSP